MEDGLFPLQRGFDDRFDPDEERRLCYVGMTRAKNKLYLSMAGFRRRWGDYTGGPSVFLKDIPEDLLEIERFNYWDGYGAAAVKSYNDNRNRKKRGTLDLELEESDIDHMLPEGARVLHDKFGKGIIVSREGSGEDLMITVRFDGYGNKKLMAKYAHLEIIGR
jgi:DNA helicase-2/ATP-dependent DNA helicase PcrA